MTLSAIVIAAAPSPPGFDGPLALAPFGPGETLIEYILRQIAGTTVRDIEVVIGDDAARVIPFASGDNIEPVPSAAGAGPAAWLRAGAGATPRGSAAALIIEVATPRSAASLQALIDARERDGATAIRASCEGAAGGPWAVAEPALSALRNARGTFATVDDAIAARAPDARSVDLGAEASLRITSPATYEETRRILSA